MAEDGLGSSDDVPYIAHSRNRAGRRHALLDHLSAVSALAATAATPFGGAELARWAGLWHDLGKFHPEFQQYLRDAEAERRGKRRGPDHKAAGAKLAMQHASPLTFVVVGHHGGLRDREGYLRPWLQEHLDEPRVDEALARARRHIDPLDPPNLLAPPSWAESDPQAAEFFIRMLFAALVDADFLDTEEHFAGPQASRHISTPTTADLWRELELDQDQLSGKRDDPVNAVRHAVYLDCVRSSELPPGFFRLTVPTGGGKTRSGLAFALRHASLHDLRRVIVALPYTSITDQTAAVYRSIFSSPYAILEHHSAIEHGGLDDDTIDREWERLTAENWDAPLIVTTTVQLFESLLGASTTACRKLHNIARSVIVLDEVQTLPEKLLDPTLAVLRELVAHYGVTVVLSTATQPALDEYEGFRGLPGIREIVSDPDHLFGLLRRVAYAWAGAHDGAWSWDRAADELRTCPQALAILNTKADALALLDALHDPDALHLSTLLCGAHRRDVLAEVRRRLTAGAPCRLISTQVVEAGVDIDFPLVLRAVGPLDRIVQAAGRCNREGRLASGRVVVFEPSEGSTPPGAYRTGSDLTRTLLAEQGFDFHDPAVYQRYFRDLYARVDLDARRIQGMRSRMEYEQVARHYRLIDDDTATVIVRYRDTLPDGTGFDAALHDLRERRGYPRALWRALQPFTVGVRRNELTRYVAQGLASEVVEGLWLWGGRYDPVRGLVADRLDADRLVI
jgi:CRISPR-associated endonuclease/helicase Cas3